jgi:hypothetical protein
MKKSIAISFLFLFMMTLASPAMASKCTDEPQKTEKKCCKKEENKCCKVKNEECKKPCTKNKAE